MPLLLASVAGVMRAECSGPFWRTSPLNFWVWKPGGRVLTHLDIVLRLLRVLPEYCMALKLTCYKQTKVKFWIHILYDTVLLPYPNLDICWT